MPLQILDMYVFFIVLISETGDKRKYRKKYRKWGQKQMANKLNIKNLT